MRSLLLAGAALLATAAAASAQIPLYHGQALDVRSSVGTMDPDSGMAVVKVRGWRLRLAANTNGIFPDREPILIQVGETPYRLEAGAMKVSRNGKVFTYRGPRSAPAPAVRLLRLKLRRDRWYGIDLTLTGVNLERLIVEAPICLPTAIIIGDDDGFSGVSF